MPAIIFLLVFLASATPVAASTYHGTINSGEGLSAIVITVPSANPVAGTYTSAQNVTLSAEGASSIHYTTDGSTPNCSGEGGGTVFSSPVVVSASLTIKALSCYSDNTSSAVSFVYTISIPAPAPSGGGGGGNGPIVGLLPPAGSGNAPAPSGPTGGNGGTPDTGGTPVVNDAPPVPTDATVQPDSGNGVVAGASTTTVTNHTNFIAPETIGTSSQPAAAASVVGGGSNYWWMLLLLLLFLLLDAWWVLNSRKFKKRS